MRLLTRSDFDGLACAVVLKEVGVIDEIKFVHPKDIQDGLVEVTEGDVLANVPYVSGCGLWFDHHSSESERLSGGESFMGESRPEKSAARIIYEFYGGAAKLPHFKEMIYFVDKVDSGDLTRDEIMNPTGFILLGFMMDPRTGLGRFRDFRISNYALMEQLIESCRTMNIDEIMALSDVQERVELYNEQNALFREMLLAHSRVDGNVILTDLRGVDPIYTGNRFLIYSLFPEQNISVWVVDGRGKQNCPIACGYSVLNRTAKTDIGKLMLKHGGGGHVMVGTCQVPYAEANAAIADIVGQMKADG